MKALFTQETFIQKANELHQNKFDYSKVTYKNLITKIKIICPIHGEFFQSPCSHLKGAGCAKCGLEKSMKTKNKNYFQTFVEKAKKIHNNKYNYSKVNYQKAVKKVEIICPEHGSFFQTPNQHLSGRGCQACGVNKRAKSRIKPFLEFCQEAEKIHNNYYFYLSEGYKGSNKKIKIQCPIHGVFSQTGRDHLQGKGCPECGKKSRVKNKTKTKTQFISQAIKIHEDKYDYSKVKYYKGRKKVEIICPIHGSFFQTPEGHLSGRGCSNCTYFISKKEKDWLDLIGLPNTSECRNVTLHVKGKVFRVDGFDPKTKTIYEFHGDYWHGNPSIYPSEEINERVKKTFGELYKATVKRENLLKEGGFRVISMWESDYNNFVASSANKLLSP